MKKVLIITGSPEKISNSTTMAKSFAKGFKKSKNIFYDTISVNDIPLEFFSYENRNPNPKTEKKFIEILEKLKTYNGLVIATPTYNFNVPARLKNFLDRIGIIALDYKKINKLGQPTGQFGHLKTFFLVSGGSPWWAQKLLFFLFPNLWLNRVFWYYGAKNSGSIYAQATFAKPVSKNEKILKKCTQKGILWSKQL